MTIDHKARILQLARDAGKPPERLCPILVDMLAQLMAQWLLVTEELNTRPALADELVAEGGLIRTVPPEFQMQAKLIANIRAILKDLGLIDLSNDPLKKLREKLAGRLPASSAN